MAVRVRQERPDTGVLQPLPQRADCTLGRQVEGQAHRQGHGSIITRGRASGPANRRAPDRASQPVRPHLGSGTMAGWGARNSKVLSSRRTRRASGARRAWDAPSRQTRCGPPMRSARGRRSRRRPGGPTTWSTSGGWSRRDSPRPMRRSTSPGAGSSRCTSRCGSRSRTARSSGSTSGPARLRPARRPARRSRASRSSARGRGRRAGAAVPRRAPAGHRHPAPARGLGRPGIIEPSVGDAIGQVLDNPDWLRLEGHTVAVLGAGAEMGPLPSLMRWGARVAAVDLDRRTSGRASSRWPRRVPGDWSLRSGPEPRDRSRTPPGSTC